MGPSQPHPLEPMESHVGNVIGHAKDAKMPYRRYCAGCHGDLGDGNGENALWLDPKPRDFTTATFKCRSTPTGTLPTDQDLFNTIGRGLTNSNMPIWNSIQQSAALDLVAYIKTLLAALGEREAWRPIKIPAEPPVTMESISHGKELFTKAGMLEVPRAAGKGDGPSAATLTDSKDQPIRPYNFAAGGDDSRFKCGSTNQDLYKIFMTGVDGTPMPSFADVIQPNDAWDLVHFLRMLQSQSSQQRKRRLERPRAGRFPPTSRSS